MVSPAAIDLIAYDAPLAFTPPTSAWCSRMSHKGTNSKKLTEEDQPPADLSGKWVLITGSNNGIGREAALKMAAWGANLILGCRDAPSKEIHPSIVVEECLLVAEKSGHKDSQVEWWEVDFASLASVEMLGKRWLETGRPLDYLCNNAGMGSSPGGNSVFKTKDGLEIIHQVNFMSHVLLTLTLLPALKAAKEPRIVCTTSCFHFQGQFDLTNFNAEKGRGGASGVSYYQNNKLWYQVWLTELQIRLKRHEDYKHITVNGVHPGYVNTGVWNLNGKMDEGLKTWAVKALAWLLAITPQQGSLCITHGVSAIDAGPDPKTQGVGVDGGLGGGRYFNRIWDEVAMPHTKDEDCRLRVWRKVNDDLQLKEKGLLDVLGVYSTE
ncbi:MAG: hypothetical protein MMC23_006154 [Stictis urceolatum]|nr:hypothetical protein [Stictis urceolata]